MPGEIFQTRISLSSDTETRERPSGVKTISLIFALCPPGSIWRKGGSGMVVEGVLNISKVKVAKMLSISRVKSALGIFWLSKKITIGIVFNKG
jgi:hypothetical protein